MASFRRAAALVVLLCLAAVGSNPLPEENSADALPEGDKVSQSENAETAAEGTTTAEPGADKETTTTPSVENQTTHTKKDADAEVDVKDEGGPDNGKRSAQEESQDSLKEDEFHSLARRHGEYENEVKSEKEGKRREDEPSHRELRELNDDEESKNGEDTSPSTKSSQPESSTDSAPTVSQDGEIDEIAGEKPVEGGQVAALQSADAIPSEDDAETSTEEQKTTVKSVGLADETGETVAPSDVAAPAVESDVPDSHRRRRRVPLKGEGGLDDKQQASNDTESEVDESVKSVALN